MNINKRDTYDEITELKEYQKYFKTRPQTFGLSGLKDITLFECIIGIVVSWLFVPLVLGGIIVALFSGWSDSILMDAALVGIFVLFIIYLIFIPKFILRVIHDIKIDKRIEKELENGILIELEDGTYVRPRNRKNCQ